MLESVAACAPAAAAVSVHTLHPVLPRQRAFVTLVSRRRRAQFTQRELLAFLRAFRGRVHSVHEDTAVSIHSGGVERPAPWALDRIDQLTLPLDGAYHYSGLGSGVNVYIVDTVRPLRAPASCSCCSHRCGRARRRRRWGRRRRGGGR